MFSEKKWPAAALLCALLAACGGGGGDTTPRAPVTSVKVFGDSLADVGTFGFKFTVQGAGNLTYPERITQTFGLGTGCNFFRFTGASFAANTGSGCTNYAIGGGVINAAGSGLSGADPRGIPVQMATAVAAGNYSANDLLVIDGGGNDAAALVGAYLAASRDGGASYLAVLQTQLTPAQLGPIVAACTPATASTCGPALQGAGVTYMSALADTFFNLIRDQALNKGAQRIALLNMPGITNTPRFQTVLDGIAAASGGGSTGTAARNGAEALFKGWVSAYNTQLAARAAGNSAIALVDFYTAFNDQIATPAQFALSNVRTPACPITGVGSDGLPTYTFPTCTATALSAAPPSGVTDPDWWKSYAFSDSFHPTPYGHQLLAQLIARSLAVAGWL